MRRPFGSLVGIDPEQGPAAGLRQGPFPDYAAIRGPSTEGPSCGSDSAWLADARAILPILDRDVGDKPQIGENDMESLGAICTSNTAVTQFNTE